MINEIDFQNYDVVGRESENFLVNPDRRWDGIHRQSKLDRFPEISCLDRATLSPEDQLIAREELQEMGAFDDDEPTDGGDDQFEEEDVVRHEPTTRTVSAPAGDSRLERAATHRAKNTRLAFSL